MRKAKGKLGSIKRHCVNYMIISSRLVCAVLILFYICFFFSIYLTGFNNRPNKVYRFFPSLVRSFYISVRVLRSRLSTNASCRYFTHARTLPTRVHDHKEIVNRVSHSRIESSWNFFRRRLRVRARARLARKQRWFRGAWSMGIARRKYERADSACVRSVDLLMRKLASRFTASD